MKLRKKAGTLSSIEVFQQEKTAEETYWRSIILFGNNVASYKFALAESLIEIIPTGRSTITLEELAEPYTRYICTHIAKSPRQTTSNSSEFLETCRKFNEGMTSKDELIGTAVKLGFNNVIDAFHNVNGNKLPVSFFEKDYSRGNKKIILTDEIYKLKGLDVYDNLKQEAEARWKLVETSWNLRISRNLLNVKYDNEEEVFFVDNNLKRKDVTSARSALNGYQKGKCFYCFDDITVCIGGQNPCDVDHFFPHTMQKYVPFANLDGVWNLVLACKDCNRGTDGKFARRPARRYLKRLAKRNEFLISSHHPLRETLITQTGNNYEERKNFYLKAYEQAKLLGPEWTTEQRGEEVF